MTVSWTPHRFTGGILALDTANTVVLRDDPQKTFDRFDDPVEIARTHAHRVRHVHLKDVRREVRADALARHLDFRDAVSLGVFAPLGDGSLDLRGTLSALRAVGYAGWLIVEQDVRLGVSPIAAPLRDAKRSRAYLTEVLAA